jgi:hypothetical protein
MIRPSPERYHHNRTGEDNADAHHKRQIMGREVVVANTGGQLDFGPWEQIFFGEFDGRRKKWVRAAGRRANDRPGLGPPGDELVLVGQPDPALPKNSVGAVSDRDQRDAHHNV